MTGGLNYLPLMALL
ncbi:CRISPR-associated DxTHG motif protein [Aequorivita antarctica]|uniref:CRISPR-associated DxTHG motif protein n=1 Tax=Aequorivita antarctica TaxID=153266 RepID=A0A5C6Z0B8_9FLAO|nr:CRISPR-associated DxTHG motif protein [Aequorivita antarctica]